VPDYHFKNECKANGCPLPVETVTDWYEPEGRKDKPRPKWGLCQFHALADGENWTEVTQRIKAHLSILQVVYAVKTIRDVDYKPLLGERVELWLARVNRALRQKILKKEVPLNQDKSSGFAALKQIIHTGE
jgi:hypothetical protein